jgi:hypothetical protein
MCESLLNQPDCRPASRIKPGLIFSRIDSWQLLPMIALLIATVDGKQRLRSLRALAASAATPVSAFGTLYFLEHTP